LEIIDPASDRQLLALLRTLAARVFKRSARRSNEFARAVCTFLTNFFSGRRRVSAMGKAPDEVRRSYFSE
jgi:hypothetical protein